MDNERIKRLPKWAQSEIEYLQDKIAKLEERLKNLEGEAPDNGVYIVSGRKKYPISNSERICKELSKGELEFDCSNKDYIRIYGYFPLRYSLVVKPVIGNVIEITII